MRTVLLSLMLLPFAAGIDAVYAAFLDYDLSTQFSGAIEKARNIEPESARAH
jgi:hypothetical protein